MADTPSSRPASPSTSPEGLAHHSAASRAVRSPSAGRPRLRRWKRATWTTTSRSDGRAGAGPLRQVSSRAPTSVLDLGFASLTDYGTLVFASELDGGARRPAGPRTPRRVHACFERRVPLLHWLLRGAVSTANSARMSVDRTPLRRRSTPGIAPPPGPHLQLRTNRREHVTVETSSIPEPSTWVVPPTSATPRLPTAQQKKRLQTRRLSPFVGSVRFCR